MNREKWQNIKNTRYFYVVIYRKLLSIIAISVALNILLCFAIIFTYWHQPQGDFYATNGMTPPIQLKVLNQPNNTSQALLASDIKNDDNSKIIPD
ncbi:MAG: phosphoesterase [Legionellaceae bacterium]|nr:phosphoesterase [Legionellaceae bacterium]HAF87635.1 phosphoesterase [Legionellales bacterium]HCA89316.1 phosphoesterase [Legionellales bacterium]|tara:strand:+ start:1492 stop:1776 length:285 start_codon:yes stop_codon:yes gene_type:complete